MFSFRLSFTIDLYTLIPVTANANKAGIKIKFWSSKLQTTKIIPFPNPNVIIVDEIAYPMQNPLKITIPNIIGNPITDEPTNHITIAKITLSLTEYYKSSELSIS